MPWRTLTSVRAASRCPVTETPSSERVKLGALVGSPIHSAASIWRRRRRSRAFALAATFFA
jgi:hypothetical protein